jgi:thiamine-monophosphate kinase
MGDDCALLGLRRGEELAVTTDLSIEGRHFRLDWHPAESIGHRTLARGLSDLAAMGARPIAAFLSLGLPRHLTGKWLDRFLDGFFSLASAFATPLAGGDLSESPIPIADIVLTGAVPRGKALLRSGAHPGDQIYVTGQLGGAAAALVHLSQIARSAHKARTSRPRRIPASLIASLAPHLYPEPRIPQGLSLSRRSLATAAIDLSDGLSTDLAHLCDESAVSAEIDTSALTIHPGATLNQALHGGEDYQLLFTAAHGSHVPHSLAGVPVARIGRIVLPSKNKPQVAILSSGNSRPLLPRGWQHFS